MALLTKISVGNLLRLSGFFLANLSLNSFAGELPIPDEDTGTMNAQGQIVYDITMQEGTMNFVPGGPTDTYGYFSPGGTSANNGNYLGPTLRMIKGDEVIINVTNNLTIDSTTHWHGFHIPPEMDGGPWQIINNITEVTASEPEANVWSPTFTVNNPVATYWYHPHIMPQTAQAAAQDPDGTSGQVYRGLAGLIFIDDETSTTLGLPMEYGVDDIPLIIQDREFFEDGSYNEFPIVDNGGLVVLRKGHTILANGEPEAVLTTGPQYIRLHILNGSNARLYNLGLTGDRTFWQIASDGGLLETPLAMSRLLLAPGERVEILLDLTGESNTVFQLLSFNSELGTDFVPVRLADDYDSSNFTILDIEVGNSTLGSNPVMTLPATPLTTIDRIQANEAINENSPRQFVMGIAGGEGMSINGVLMDITVYNEDIALNTTEIWQLDNPAQQFHPIHVHGNAFQILSRNGDPSQVDANEMGWKDVVIVPPGETVEVIKRFIDFSDETIPYMYHCHILDHEDAGMMGQFRVLDLDEEEDPADPIEPADPVEPEVESDSSGGGSLGFVLIALWSLIFVSGRRNLMGLNNLNSFFHYILNPNK